MITYKGGEDGVPSARGPYWWAYDEETDVIGDGNTKVEAVRNCLEGIELKKKILAGPPSCPKCGNNRQVWTNQVTGKMTCHRLGCHHEFSDNVERQ